MSQITQASSQKEVMAGGSPQGSGWAGRKYITEKRQQVKRVRRVIVWGGWGGFLFGLKIGCLMLGFGQAGCNQANYKVARSRWADQCLSARGQPIAKKARPSGPRSATQVPLKLHPTKEAKKQTAPSVTSRPSAFPPVHPMEPEKITPRHQANTSSAAHPARRPPCGSASGARGYLSAGRKNRRAPP